MVTPDEDFSEADVSADDFDAMWDQGEPVQTLVRTTRATAGVPIRSAIRGSTVATRSSAADTASTSSASTIAVSPAKPRPVKGGNIFVETR